MPPVPIRRGATGEWQKRQVKDSLTTQNMEIHKVFSVFSVNSVVNDF